MVAEDRFAHVLENLYMAALGDVGWDTGGCVDQRYDPDAWP